MIFKLIKNMYIKKYEKNLRKKIKNKEISIICPNCIGGIIYHRLGLKFLSPTINLWMWQYDYLKFVSNLEYYISLKLDFIESENSYPVAKLGDITLHFNHYKTKMEANECWNRRKKRINYDNLFLIMYDKDGITKEDLKKLESIKCKGKIVISNKTYDDLNYIIKIPANMNNPKKRYRLEESKITGVRKFEKYFDYVTWLNNGN